MRPIGHTPLVPIALMIGGRARPVHLKLEGANPRGSLKDRTAASLVTDLERRGALAPGSILIESTSGNMGVSLAWIARRLGYGFVAVVDPRTTAENLARMHRLGAQIELVERPDEAGGYLLSRLERVRELCAASERFVWPDQYGNAANPRAHEEGTGPEILEQMGGAVDTVFVAVSTGGTLAGVGRYLRRESSQTRIVAVDAAGSVALGGRPERRLLTGIGASRRSAFATPDLYDDHVLVGDAAAFAFCRALATQTGLQLGGSSGAVLAACGRFLAEHRELERVVCVCADRGASYASTIFNDRWLARHRIHIHATGLGPVEAIIPAGKGDLAPA